MVSTCSVTVAAGGSKSLGLFPFNTLLACSRSFPLSLFCCCCMAVESVLLLLLRLLLVLVLLLPPILLLRLISPLIVSLVSFSFCFMLTAIVGTSRRFVADCAAATGGDFLTISARCCVDGRARVPPPFSDELPLDAETFGETRLALVLALVLLLLALLFRAPPPPAAAEGETSSCFVFAPPAWVTRKRCPKLDGGFMSLLGGSLESCRSRSFSAAAARSLEDLVVRMGCLS